ncbi:MAG: YadA-like family protein [Burkholderiaceae bacterium]
MVPGGDGEHGERGCGYRGQSAVGLAYARQIGSVVVNGGLAFGSGKHHLVRLGAGWRF